MGAYYPLFITSRILYDADRTGAADENVNVTDWVKTNKFILCVQMGYNGKDTAASAYKWQWRNDTDNPGGLYSDVASTGEIAWASTSAVLVEGNAVDDAGDDRRCSAAAGQSWQDGLENVGDNLTPDSGTFDLGSDSYTEFQAAFDPAAAHAGDVYSFRLYNNTADAAVNTGTYVTLTIKSDAFNMKVMVDGTWKIVPSAMVMVNGVWKPVTSMKVMVNGVWKTV